MPQEGLWIQCDASPFLWLEDRSPLLHLHGIIDDATSKVLGVYFRPQEDSLDGVVQPLSPKTKVTVLTHMDGTLGALYKNQYSEYDLYILERDRSWRQKKEKLLYET